MTEPFPFIIQLPLSGCHIKRGGGGGCEAWARQEGMYGLLLTLFPSEFLLKEKVFLSRYGAGEFSQAKG